MGQGKLTLKTLASDFQNYGRDQSLSCHFMYIVLQGDGTASIQPVPESPDADINIIQILPIESVDVCIHHMVAQFARNLQREFVCGEVGGS